MTKILVLSKGNHGDEIDLEGFVIFDTLAEWEKAVEGIPDKPHDAYYGSNEFVVFENRKDYLEYITVTEISDEEADTLRRLLRLTGRTPDFGLFVINSENY